MQYHKWLSQSQGWTKEATTEEYILYDSIHIKFKKRQNLSMVVEVWKVATLRGHEGVNYELEKYDTSI